MVELCVGIKTDLNNHMCVIKKICVYKNYQLK